MFGPAALESLGVATEAVVDEEVAAAVETWWPLHAARVRNATAVQACKSALRMKPGRRGPAAQCRGNRESPNIRASPIRRGLIEVPDSATSGSCLQSACKLSVDQC